MNPAWEPEFEDWSEDKVSMSSCELSTSCMSRGEYGVMMQIGAGDENLPIDAAIFWTDEMHLYLRYNWESWYKVSNDDPDNFSCVLRRPSSTTRSRSITSTVSPRSCLARRIANRPTAARQRNLTLTFRSLLPKMKMTKKRTTLRS